MSGKAPKPPAVHKLETIAEYKNFTREGKSFVLFAKNMKVSANAAHKLEKTTSRYSIRMGTVDLNKPCFQSEWLNDVKNFKKDDVYVMYFDNGKLQNTLPDFEINIYGHTWQYEDPPQTLTILLKTINYELRFKWDMYYPTCSKPLAPFVDNYINALLGEQENMANSG